MYDLALVSREGSGEEILLDSLPMHAYREFEIEAMPIIDDRAAWELVEKRNLYSGGTARRAIKEGATVQVDDLDLLPGDYVIGVRYWDRGDGSQDVSVISSHGGSCIINIEHTQQGVRYVYSELQCAGTVEPSLSLEVSTLQRRLVLDVLTIRPIPEWR